MGLPQIQNQTFARKPPSRRKGVTPTFVQMQMSQCQDQIKGIGAQYPIVPLRHVMENMTGMFLAGQADHLHTDIQTGVAEILHMFCKHIGKTALSTPNVQDTHTLDKTVL